MLIEHHPLLALADNCDPNRYTACFDLAPWRAGVAAGTGRPQAPLARYALQPRSRDLLFPEGVLVAGLLRSACGFALMCAIVTTPGAGDALFGDGDAPFATHAQLSTNYALASPGVAFLAPARRALQRGVQP